MAGQTAGLGHDRCEETSELEGKRAGRQVKGQKRQVKKLEKAEKRDCGQSREDSEKGREQRTE